MTVTYGFYNSVNNDRLYDAKQVSRLFEGIINDGVFMTIGTSLMVTSAAGMNVTIGVGRAWFNKTWTDNDTPFNIAVPASHMTLNRIDTVVLEIDTTEAVRANSIKVVSGVPGTNPVRPTLNPPAEVYQYPLADLSIPAGAVTIPQGNITNRVGTVDCPFITGVMENMDVDALVAQWEAQFNVWFSQMQSLLSPEAEVILQNQIDVLRAFDKRNAIVNGSMRLCQRGPNFDKTWDLTLSTTPTYFVDRFCAYKSTADLGFRQYWSSASITGLNISRALRIYRFAGGTNTNLAYVVHIVDPEELSQLLGKSVTFSFYGSRGADFSASGQAIGLKVGYGKGYNESVASLVAGTWNTFGLLVNTNQALTTSYVRYSYTFTVPSDATELGVVFTFTPTGTAGANDSFYITGLQLEDGVLSPFKMKTYEDDLRIAQKYYWQLRAPYQAYFNVLSHGAVYADSKARFYVRHPVPMRTTPILHLPEEGGGSNFYISGANGSAGWGLANANITLYQANNTHVEIRADAITGGMTIGQIVALTTGSNDRHMFVGFDAEYY